MVVTLRKRVRDYEIYDVSPSLAVFIRKTESDRQAVLHDGSKDIHGMCTVAADGILFIEEDIRSLSTMIDSGVFEREFTAMFAQQTKREFIAVSIAHDLPGIKINLNLNPISGRHIRFYENDNVVILPYRHFLALFDLLR